MGSRNRFNKEPRESYQFPGGVSNYKRDGGSRARSNSQKGRTVGAVGAVGVVGARGSGLNWSEDGRPYIEDGGRRVFSGDAASRYEESPEAAVDNAENLEGTTFYTGTEGQSSTGRDSRRGGATGTQMTPKGADFDAFQKTLEQNYGINFNFGQGRGGMQSNSLPNTPGNVPDTSSGNIVRISNGQNSGNYVKVDNPNFDKIVRGEVVGGFSQAQGAQAGTSSDADVGDQMRALRFDPTKYKEDPERPTDIYETADVGIGRRGAAFLDYDGNSAMALRAAEASQGTIRQNGVTYGKGEDGNWTAISEEGNKALKADGNKIASQDFLKQYMATPAESQSESSGNPAPASRETYQQMADKELTGTVYVPSETNKVEAFAPNASIYSGNPKDFNLEDSDFFQGQPTGEPNKSWLPTEDENKEREELMRGLY